MVDVEDLLDIGIFTPAEAAVYARVRTGVMNRWIFGDAIGESVLVAQLAGHGEKVVTFLDFVQTLAVRVLRTRHKIPLERIRQAVMVAREQGIKYPFAVEHTTYIYGDPEGTTRRSGVEERLPSDIAIKIGGKIIQASGHARRNLLIRPVAELYMKDLHFDPESGFADEYIAWKRDEQRIVMNPRRRFGEPIVERCGYTASTLWEAYEIEGGIEAAARAYGVENRDVELACEYYDHLLNNAA